MKTECERTSGGVKYCHESRGFRTSEKKALALPAEARAALAGSLLESLEDTLDASAEEEWSQEIARRIAELDSGKVKPIPWAEARRQISAILNGR